jgi:hypothetical protein
MLRHRRLDASRFPFHVRQSGDEALNLKRAARFAYLRQAFINFLPLSHSN